jgi:hypothetical protein
LVCKPYAIEGIINIDTLKKGDLLTLKSFQSFVIALHGFIGVGAISGGTACLANPFSPLGTTVEMLKNSPFESFLIPGILLFSVIGIGNIFAAILVLKNWDYWGYSTGILGGALVIWIVVQCIMLQAIAFLHGLFFIFGLLQICLGLARLFEKHQFPMGSIHYQKQGKT